MWGGRAGASGIVALPLAVLATYRFRRLVFKTGSGACEMGLKLVA